MRYALALAAVAFIAFAGIALMRSGLYGWTLFALVPLFLGGIPGLVFRPSTPGKAARYGAYTLMGASCLLLLVGLDGIICIFMALPLVTPLGALGGWLAYRITHAEAPRSSTAVLLLLPIATFTWDCHAIPPVFHVTTQVIVNAEPEFVWKYVIAFPELPEKREWLFHTGLAYPIRAHIDGQGPGAIRYCDFSTGPFVEPIETWNEPRLLRFRVTANPRSLDEWSPFSDVNPRHLHGYLVSKQGQFRLMPLPGGRTLLEGTTWYQHGLWPAQYWRWWSDAIIHRIHLRVLNHVKTLAEQAAQG